LRAILIFAKRKDQQKRGFGAKKQGIIQHCETPCPQATTSPGKGVSFRGTARWPVTTPAPGPTPPITGKNKNTKPSRQRPEADQALPDDPSPASNPPAPDASVIAGAVTPDDRARDAEGERNFGTDPTWR